MWKIGDIGIEGRVVLGPMSGFTSRAYRDFMKPFGVAVSITEMASATGVLHGMGKTGPYIRFEGNYPTGVQLFGGDPDTLASAAEKALEVNPEIAFFDVNMGCPVAKVVRNQAGSFLMKEPGRCAEIVRKMKSKVDVPVTAKIRLGWSAGTVNFREIIPLLEEAGADAVMLHARTREERYAGEPHYDMVEGLRKEMSVPLVISGNIYSLNDAIRAAEITGAEGIMAARGAVGNPYLITQIDRYFRTGERLPNPTVSQQVEWCKRFSDAIIEESGDEVGIRRLRAYAPRFIAGCHGCREYRKRLATETYNREALFGILDEIDSLMGDDRIFTEGRGPYEE